MKKIISLIILSLIFKSYVCEDCVKGEDNTCTGGEEGKTVCVLVDDKCELKNLCKTIEPQAEADCTGAPTTDDSKYECEFQAKGSEEGSKNQCKEVEKEEKTTDTTKSSTKSDEKTDDTTKNTTKVDEKNGANYAKLSFGLLTLLFF